MTGADEQPRKERALGNNLASMRSEDQIYSEDARRILRSMGKQMQGISESVPQLPIMAADIFYSFYSLKPVLKEGNETDPLLEVVRGIMDRYMQSDTYMEVRGMTMLHEEMAMERTVSIVSNLMRKIADAMKEQYGNGRSSGTSDKKFEDMAQKAQAGDRTAKEIMNELFRMALKKMGRDAFEGMLKESLETAEIGSKEIIGEAQREALPYRPIDVNLANQIIATARKLMQSVPKFAEDGKVHGPTGDRIAGYRMTRKPHMAIPKEHAMPDEIFFAKMMSEGWMALDKYSLQEGAYYVLVDKSSSMHGQKTVWARSVALALYEQAKRHGKKYMLRFFNEVPSTLVEGQEEVADAILNVSSGGGTDIDGAIGTALLDLSANGRLARKTNTVIIITDGDDGVARDWAVELKKVNCRLVSVMVQGENEQLRAASDMYFSVQPTTSSALEVLKAMKRSGEKSWVKASS